MTIAASLYFLSYGLLQPVWGVVLARLGTIRTLQLALLGAAAAGLLSALSPGVVVLIVLRGDRRRVLRRRGAGDPGLRRAPPCRSNGGSSP